jgi:poly-gamma-glutamate capsule biosynthesis protein CapA/YwtB (metallophosphatase superfamily)
MTNLQTASERDIARFSREEAKSHMESLRREVRRHNYLYYVRNQPEISDVEYDRLFAVLKRLEEAFPDLVTPDSPPQRVGAEPGREFPVSAHVAPMLSLDATHEADEVRRLRQCCGLHGDRGGHDFTMKLLVVGDVMLGRLVNQILQHEPPAYPWGDTLAVFRAADFRLCNLECVMADRGRPWSMTPKRFHFRSDAKNVAVLKAAHIDCVSLANNHTLDFEDEALLEMLPLLDEAGIGHAGAGRDWMESIRPATFLVRGRRIGVIALTDNEPQWAAEERKPGIFYVPVDMRDARATRLLELVRRSKEALDVLIVSAHWGPNWGYRPPPAHPPFARALIEAGADVIFGHSGHVFRGVECYRERPIIYCAGDFIDDYAVDEVERNNQSFIFVLELDDGRVQRLRLYPTVIRNLQARLARSGEAEDIAAKMQRLCAEWHTKAIWRDHEQCLLLEA